MARRLEGMAAALEHVTGLEASSPVPTWIFIFADNASLHPYKHLYNGQPASMSGALYSRPWGDYIAMNGARPNEALITVFHEYVHVVLRNNLPGIPLWLEEGLAELFSTFRQTTGPEGTIGQLGRPVPWHLDELGRGELAPLRSILEANVSSPLYNRFEHQGEFYARSWELAHYLIIGRPERLEATLNFLSRTFQGVPTEQAFEQAFGLSIEAFDLELASYRGTVHQTRKVQLPPVDLSPSGLKTLPYPELLLHLGELLISQSDRAGDAIFHFEQALERRPDLGRAYTGLGLIAREDGDLPRARALFSRAVKTADDAKAHYFYGQSLLRLGRAVSLEKRQTARRHLERSVELDPSFAPAWLTVALAHRLTAPRKPARESGPGTTHSPTLDVGAPPDVALDVLMLHSRSRSRDAAIRLWRDYFEPRPDSAERRAAARVLERLEWLERGGPPPDILRPPAPPPPAPPAAPSSAQGNRPM